MNFMEDVFISEKMGCEKPNARIFDCLLYTSDLCTVKEISDMAQRLQAAKLLLDGATYEQIVKAVEDVYKRQACILFAATMLY